MGEPLLRMRSITKVFPGTKALDNVNLEVMPGEIHALVGENGAGKSTLMNVLSGVYPFGSYEGDIEYGGEVRRFSKIKDSEKIGIVIIHQELALVPYMTIGENMFLGNEKGSASRINWSETYAAADEHLKVVGLTESSRTLIKDIGVGKQQLVEIAKALAKNVKLLILDEPTASLNEEDSQNLLKLLLKFKEEGMTSIIISHKLNEIEQVADKITVIRDGSTIETLTKGVDDLSEPRIIKGMVGREISDRYPKRQSNIGDVTLEVKNWTVYHPLYKGRKVCDNISFNVRKGEVVGISGLMGAGRTELAMSIFGRSYGTGISGDLYLKGQRKELKTIREAIDNKIAYVTEDRKGDGLILKDTIRMNMTLANLNRICKFTVIDKEREINYATNFKASFRVKCAGIEQNVGNLSGGNQQKVLLAKWMFAKPDVLILDEPTRGIDVGAKYEIYNIINELVAEEKAVLLISSDMPELLGMCDRIYVMNEGRMAGELSKEEAGQEVIMSLILQSCKGA
ncbi:MAG: ATP-binding cassette domain-containing protein [Oscillospiraceae bacterium]|nr:ATP-binding cassette domain-containing protein [Oscillospiraceae bacterium]